MANPILLVSFVVVVVVLFFVLFCFGDYFFVFLTCHDVIGNMV